jgi:hypothetical protein
LRVDQKEHLSLVIGIESRKKKAKSKKKEQRKKTKKEQKAKSKKQKAKSKERIQAVAEEDGRLVGTRTPDLHRVKVAL